MSSKPRDATQSPRPNALSPQQLTANPRPLPNGVLARERRHQRTRPDQRQRTLHLSLRRFAAREALRMLGRHASNPELSFSWYDAAVLSQKIRQEERQQRSRLRMPQVTDSEELF